MNWLVVSTAACRKISKTSVNMFFFANRVINSWTSLPDHFVASPSVACFKRKLSKFHFNFFSIMAPVSAALCCLCVLLTHYFLFYFSQWCLYFCVTNKFDLIWLIWCAAEITSNEELLFCSRAVQDAGEQKDELW